jgi:hypothetical protein
MKRKQFLISIAVFIAIATGITVGLACLEPHLQRSVGVEAR